MRRIFPASWYEFGMLKMGPVVAMIVVGLIVFASSVAVVSWRVSVASCERQADRLRTEWLYDLWGEGCFLQLESGEMVPAHRWRIETGRGVVEGDEAS